LRSGVTRGYISHPAIRSKREFTKVLSFNSSRPALHSSLLLISILLAGCVTDQSAPPVASTIAPVPRGQAGITITRLSGYYGFLAAADIEANGTKIASLDKGGATFSGSVPPGPVTLTVSCACDLARYSIHFKAQAGKHYAFEVSPRNEQYAAIVFGGLVGYVADTAINGENSGTFKIVEVPGNRT
jgi:hypothetical protein